MQKEHPIRLWRRDRQMTLAELAFRVDCSISHLSEVETLDKDISFSLARKLSKITGLSMETIAKRVNAQ